MIRHASPFRESLESSLTSDYPLGLRMASTLVNIDKNTRRDIFRCPMRTLHWATTPPLRKVLEERRNC